MEMKRILTVLAPGFEEIEAVGVVDVLRRLGCEVVLASLFGGQTVTGSHMMTLGCDCSLAEADGCAFDAVYLPGGSLKLLESPFLGEMLKRFDREEKIIGAICAAPAMLAQCGLLKKRRFTLYPGLERYLDGAVSTGAVTERDGHIVTGRGPGAVFDFAAELAAALGFETKELYGRMFVQRNS